MKKNVLILLACLGLSSCLGPRPQWQVYFSPEDRPGDVIVAELGKASSSILVQAYSFTSVPIANALVAAHKRGVSVTVILDAGQRQSPSAALVSREGITTLFDAERGKAHNKILLIDGLVVITGSYNLSKAAEESNAENLLVIRDKALVAAYLANWNRHAKKVKQFEPQSSPADADAGSAPPWE